MDNVSKELTDLNVTYETRFREITGFTTDEATEINDSGPRAGQPKWDGVTPKEGQGSELEL